MSAIENYRAAVARLADFDEILPMLQTATVTVERKDEFSLAIQANGELYTKADSEDQARLRYSKDVTGALVIFLLANCRQAFLEHRQRLADEVAQARERARREATDFLAEVGANG